MEALEIDFRIVFKTVNKAHLVENPVSPNFTQ